MNPNDRDEILVDLGRIADTLRVTEQTAAAARVAFDDLRHRCDGLDAIASEHLGRLLRFTLGDLVGHLQCVVERIDGARAIGLVVAAFSGPTAPSSPAPTGPTDGSGQPPAPSTNGTTRPFGKKTGEC